MYRRQLCQWLRSVFASALAVSLIFAASEPLELQITTRGKWPSLHFHFVIKRTRIHGFSHVSVLATPILSRDATSVLLSTQIYTITHKCSQCLESLTLIVVALNCANVEATIHDSNGSALLYSSQQSFKLAVNSIPSDMDIQVIVVDSPLDLKSSPAILQTSCLTK